MDKDEGMTGVLEGKIWGIHACEPSSRPREMAQQLTLRMIESNQKCSSERRRCPLCGGLPHGGGQRIESGAWDVRTTARHLGDRVVPVRLYAFEKQATDLHETCDASLAWLP